MPAVAERLPWTLRAYRGFASMATPLSRLVLARRLRRGKEHPQRLAERRGGLWKWQSTQKDKQVSSRQI